MVVTITSLYSKVRSPPYFGAVPLDPRASLAETLRGLKNWPNKALVWPLVSNNYFSTLLSFFYESVMKKKTKKKKQTKTLLLCSLITHYDTHQI